MINNRQQNGRRRGRGNQRPQPGGNISGGNRSQDNGNRIDNRSRGNAAQLLEKYKTLARDAQQSGDRVLTEYYLQFSDHYFRVLADTRARYEENQPRRDGGPDRADQAYDGGDDNDDGFDGDEFDPRPQSRVQAPQAQPGYDREPQAARERSDEQDRPRRDDQERPRRDEQDRPRRDYGDRPRGANNGNGQDRAARDDARQEGRQERPVRDERPAREARPRDDRPRDDRPAVAREPRPMRDDLSEESTLSRDLLPPAIAITPLPDVDAEPVAAPKRRGRPKKVVDEATSAE